MYIWIDTYWKEVTSQLTGAMPESAPLLLLQVGFLLGAPLPSHSLEFKRCRSQRRAYTGSPF